MPELPEVETVIRSLSILKGKVFSKVEVFKHYLLKNGLTESSFSSAISGQSINDIKRKGKYIFIVLDDWVIINHLRMTGKYFTSKIPGVTDRRENLGLNFIFEDGSALPFYDARNFATFHLQRKDEYKNIYPYNSIGLDLVDDEVDINYLFNAFQKKKIPIKSALLEQSIVSGIGNIYASEILFEVNVHPLTVTNSISKDKLREILSVTRRILELAIQLKGSSIVDFVSPDNEKGSFQNELKVYGRASLKCLKCPGKISRIAIDNRSTFFCENCQPLKVSEI